MLAERPKLSVTRTSSKGPRGSSGTRPVRTLLFGVLLGAGVLACGPDAGNAQGRSTSASPAPARKGGDIRFSSPEAAYNHGRSALQSGHPEMAIKAFEYAAERDVFLAQYFLARIYADNNVSYTNHGRAFELFQQIVTEHADVDVDDDPRAPFVAKAMTALAGYYRSGIPSAGVAPDLDQAVNLVRNAAKTFRDDDAQFDYAKMLLTGEGLVANPREAVYWLRGLTTRGHTGAQAFLADLYWRGQHVQKDPTQALLLITLAAENASAADRVWIEDKYQNIFCGAGEGVRKQAQGAVADWRSKYGRSREERLGPDGLVTIQPRAVRTCGNGETAHPLRRGEITGEPSKPRPEPNGALRPAGAPMSSNGGDGFMQGSTGSFGFSLRDAGQTTIGPAPAR